MIRSQFSTMVMLLSAEKIKSRSQVNLIRKALGGARRVRQAGNAEE